MESLILVASIGLLLLWGRFSKARLKSGSQDKSALNPEALNILSFDDDRISLSCANGEVHAVRWVDLTMVGVRTTDEGPFLPDVFWGLHGADKKPVVVYAQGASGEPALLDAMQKRLAGFDNSKLIEAMGCASNAFFLIWEKS
jgi:hypothetical protein